MNILLAQIPTSSVSTSDKSSPAPKSSLVIEHLLYSCAKFETLPAITVKVEADRVTVVRGYEYLEVARRLTRPTVRAVIVSSPDSLDVKNYLRRPDVTVLDWKKLQEDERQDSQALAWHVFFFERALSPDDKLDFDQRVTALFSKFNEVVEVRHEDFGPLAEFQARTPTGDQSWATQHRSTFDAFSKERVRIVSFQGAKFGGLKAPPERHDPRD